MQLEFLKPARIDEILEVTTRVKETTAATLVLDQRVCARRRRCSLPPRSWSCWSRQSGKPLRLSAALRDALQDKPA